MIKKFQLVSLLVSATFVVACSATGNGLVSNTAASSASSGKASSQAPTSVTQVKANPKAGSLVDIELSLNQIMSDPDWLGRQPQKAFFSPLGDSILYYRKREGSNVQDLFETTPEQGNGNKVAHAQLHEHAVKDVIDDTDYSFVAWIFEGNIFIQDRITKKIKQLSKDVNAARNLAYYDNGNGQIGVSFQRGNSFYLIDANTGLQAQLLEWRFAEKAKAVDAPKDYIAQEQQKLIKYVQVERKNKQDKYNQQAAIGADNTSIMSATFYFDKEHTNVLASLSPNGKYAIIVTRKDVPSRDDSDIMPDYIEEDGRIKAHSARQRVADAKSQSHDIVFVDIEKNTQTKLSYVTLPGYNEDVLAEVKRENAQLKGEKYTENRLPRDIGLLFDWYATQMPIKWHDNSSQVALMLEAWDNKDRWIASVDVNAPKIVSQHRMHDSAWVNYKFNQFGWFEQSNTLYLLSEESGYSQLYTKALNGKLKQLTSGRYVVDDVLLSKNDDYFYYKANKKHPGIYEIYRIPSSGGKAQALTELNGMSDYVLSPSEDTLLLTHSTLGMPPELYTLKMGADEAPLRLTHTVSDAFLSIDWNIPSIVAVESSHTEQAIYARVYTPKKAPNDGEKHRAVVFNHGAGYLQNAHLGWSGYFREFMFHSLLSSQGYVVLDMDYRASAGYGRDWRTAIYRQMGTPEVQDLKDGVNWLVQNANVDRNRIGTYGGSYGGFLTFMALFNEPDLFQAGAALRPVSDWAHYNTAYTANILNTPSIDPIAYERSSPIYFAAGLTKPLLINAPMVDDNVFFVDVVRLVQILIELEKEDFETAIYPVEPHGFVQPSSWLDEYRRIYKLFETNL